MEALKIALKELNAGFEEFKKVNDARLKLVESKGSAPADYDEKIAKLNESMDTASKAIETLQAVKNEPTADETKAKNEIVIVKGQEAFDRYMRKGGMSLTDAHVDEIKAAMELHSEQKLLAVNVDRDGGFFVRPEFDSEIRKKIFESSPMRALSDQQTISTDSIEFNYDDDEVEDGWVGETETRGDTDNSQLNQVKIFVHELFAQPKATQKLLDDSAVNIEAWLAGKVQARFGRSEATSFVSGNGVSKPKGFLSYPNGDGSFGTVEQINSGSAGGVTADGLILLQNGLLEEFQSSAVFAMKRATAGVVRQLKDNEDRYLWSMSGDLTSGAMQSLLGKPIHFFNDMPDIAANSLSIAYGDFRVAYLIVDRIGIRILRDPYTSKGNVKFYSTKRVGGGMQQFQALKLQKLAV